MWELDYEESRMLKNLCFWTVVLDKTLESPLDCKEIQPVHPKGNQSWIFIGRTDIKAETPILWPPDAKSWLLGKDPDAANDWRQKEKGTTENEMVGWHHWLNCKEIQPVHPKGNQSWIFIGRTDANTEALILWPPDVKNWLIGKDPDAGKDWSQEEKGTTEDEMTGWHHQLDEHEFEQAPDAGNGQGSLACCSPWGHKLWTWLRGWTDCLTAFS